MTRPILRLGSRQSTLAMAQSRGILAELQELRPEATIEIVPIVTTGDLMPSVAFDSVGTVGMFVTEIERALLDDRIDLAVHSLKDLPTALTPGLLIAAVPARANPFDVVIWREPPPSNPGPDPRLGTGSPRRAAQLRARWPGAHVSNLRGNVDTRLRRLDEGDLDGIVLAAAGLERLGLLASLEAAGRLEFLDTLKMVPAPGQGCLGIQCRAADHVAQQWVAALDDSPSRAAALAERALLAALGGGCLAPIAALAHVTDGTPPRLHLLGLVISLDGRSAHRESLDGPIDDPTSLGVRMAHALFAKGAGSILEISAVIEPE
ncbi:MAG: hydroxymethylbilane synthase [Candidatus Eisenbacteria bacterium]|nr:hydroxymethylbilane synthase [Candidatus Eisenbacteria bacterium]